VYLPMQRVLRIHVLCDVIVPIVPQPNGRGKRSVRFSIDLRGIESDGAVAPCFVNLVML
jgi:hypothetical protein